MAVVSPSDHGLAQLWEADLTIRERLRANNGKLLVWPLDKNGKPLIGQMSLPALGLNVRVLSLMASWWCPKAKGCAKGPSVQVVRKQARQTIHNCLHALRVHDPNGMVACTLLAFACFLY